MSGCSKVPTSSVDQPSQWLCQSWDCWQYKAGKTSSLTRQWRLTQGSVLEREKHPVKILRSPRKLRCEPKRIILVVWQLFQGNRGHVTRRKGKEL